MLKNVVHARKTTIIRLDVGDIREIIYRREITQRYIGIVLLNALFGLDIECLV